MAMPVEPIEAGVDVVDTCLAPFALRTSMPAVEPLVAALTGMPRDSGLDLQKLLKLGEHLESIAPKYKSFLADHKLSIIDSEVLRYCSPMIPLRTGTLEKSGTLGTVIGSGEVKYIAPYARFQYFNTSQSREYDSRRGGMWFERMKVAHKAAILKLVGGK